MPDFTEAEAIAAWQSRQSAAETLAGEMGITTDQALAELGYAPAYMKAGYQAPPPSDYTLTMTPQGLAPATQAAPNVPVAITPAVIAAMTPEPPAPVVPVAGLDDGTGWMSPELTDWLQGGDLPMTNGNVLPGSSPGATSMSMVTGVQPTLEQSNAWWSILLGGGTLFLGVIRWLIAKVGWQAIAALLGTALAAKVLAMLNDGTPDDMAVVIPGTGTAVSGTIVKTWNAGGWPFWMDSSGRIYTKNKAGIVKSWKPKKPIVLVRGSTTLSQYVRAQRYLDKMARTIAKRTKALKLA